MNFADLERTILIFPGGFNGGGGALLPEIESAERALNVRIVGGYRDFLLRFGWIEIGSVVLYGIGKDIPPYLNLVAVTLSERSEMKPQLALSLLPFFNDGFGNLYCLDTNASPASENPVVFWDHDLSPNQQPALVSPSFTEWLAQEIRLM
jgi:SMI1-KNR4 cell-wall